MFFMGRRAMRGRRGKSLILAGLVLFLIGLAITAGRYSLASGRGGVAHFVSWTPMIIGVVGMVRGALQMINDRRAGVPGPGPGQEIPQARQQPPDAPAEAPAGAQDQPAQDQPAYDQPGYGLPRNPAGPPDPS